MISSDRIARLPEFGEREEVCGRCHAADRAVTQARCRYAFAMVSSYICSRCAEILVDVPIMRVA
jgi:hypothetical protein